MIGVWRFDGGGISPICSNLRYLFVSCMGSSRQPARAFFNGSPIRQLLAPQSHSASLEVDANHHDKSRCGDSKAQFDLDQFTR